VLEVLSGIKSCPALQETTLGEKETSAEKVKPLLLKRAEAFQKLGEYNKAMGDIQQVIALDRTNDENVLLAQNLVKEQEKKLEESELSSLGSMQHVLDVALSWTLRNPAPDKERADHECWSKSTLAIRQLLYRMKQDDIIQNFIRSNGVSRLLKALEVSQSLNGDDASDWKWECIAILHHCCCVPLGTSIIAHNLSENAGLRSLFNTLNSPKTNGLLLDLLVTLMLNYSENSCKNCPSPFEYDSNRARAIQLVAFQTFLAHLQPTNAKDVRTVAANSLMKLVKASSDKHIAEAVLGSELLHDVAQMAVDDAEGLRDTASVIFSSLFQTLKSTDEDMIQAKVACRKLFHRLDYGASLSSSSLQFLTAINEAGFSNITTYILTEDDLLPSMMETIELENEVTQSKFIEFLCQGCSDKAVRKLVATHCVDYLRRMATHPNEDTACLSAVTLTKLTFVTEDQSLSQDMSKCNTSNYELFSKLIKKQNGKVKDHAHILEGLMFVSLTSGDVKNRIVKDTELLSALKNLVGDNGRALNYGVTIVLFNVSAYKEKLTEEQVQMLKLQRIARQGAQGAEEVEDPSNSDEKVKERNYELVKSGIIPLLVQLVKHSVKHSDIQEKLCQIFLSIATDERNRGQVVQQGGVRCILMLFDQVSEQGKKYAAQALAKIAISMNPAVAFKGEQVFECIRPLLQLLKSDYELHQFEGLLGLTNLASMDEPVRKHILSLQGFKQFEALQLADNARIRCAATEAICNMLFSPEVFDNYLQTTQSSRFRIFIAIGSDVEDFSSCRAASGALAIMSQHPKLCELFIQEKNMIPLLEALLVPSLREELVHRGIECAKNMSAIPDIAKRFASESRIPLRIRELVHSKLPEAKHSPVSQAIVKSALEALGNLEKAAKM
jgi:hypothetical protein